MAEVCLPRLDVHTRRNPNGLKPGMQGLTGRRRRTLARVGEVAVGSQGVGDTFSGGSRPEEVDFCGGSFVSSGDGALRCGSPAASPAKSTQGKDP
jgi:hypothetical protein